MNLGASSSSLSAKVCLVCGGPIGSGKGSRHRPKQCVMELQRVVSALRVERARYRDGLYLLLTIRGVSRVEAEGAIDRIGGGG